MPSMLLFRGSASHISMQVPNECRHLISNDIVVIYFIDEELFSGMYIDFMGTDSAIFRSLTKRNAVRTDQHNSKWLSGKCLSKFFLFFF